MPLLEHFDLLAPHYERFIKPAVPERLLELLAIPPDGNVLDVGGGTGRVAQYFLRFAPQVIVADLSMAMLMQAGKKDGLLRVCSAAEGLPFSDEAFDRICMLDALHHVIDQQQTCRELWRVLKPAGRLVIGEPDIRLFGTKIVALVEKMALMRSHILSPARIAACFDHPEARSRIVPDAPTAWIVIEKA